MKSTDDQGLIPVIVASEADSTYIRTIPTAQPAAGDGSVSLELGLPPECATAVAAGGKRPQEKDMNGIWNLFSRAIQSLQAYRGVYNASFATAIGGYPKYAMVSDSSGNFWVSTADGNTTVPGATGASWQSLFNGYLTQSDAADTYYPIAGGYVGGYVTTNTNTHSGNLYYGSSVGSRINGYQINNPNVSTTTGQTYSFDMWMEVNIGAKTYGVLRAWTWQGERRWTLNEDGQITSDINGNVAWENSLAQYATLTDLSTGLAGKQNTGDYATNSALNSGLAGKQNVGDYATNSALSSGLASKENAGVCVPISTYESDFSTSDGRVINLAYGHRIQAFTITVDGNGTNSHRITYPVAFSGASSVAFVGNDTSQSRSVSLSNNTTPDSTGFNISVSVHGNSTAGSTDGLTLSVIAVGPK